MPDRTQVERIRPTPYGIGLPLFQAGTQPAAGANFSFSMDSFWIQVLKTIRFQLVTDANAANRVVTVDYVDGNNSVIVSNGPGLTMSASDTRTFQGKTNMGFSDWTTTSSDSTPIYFPIEPLMLVGSWKVQINVANKQAGDQLSAIRMMFDQFTSETFVTYLPGDDY